MRFLQTEWHRHERDRNAWQIERAEMKSRIGKLEGESRTSKRLQESLGKHIKILESALKREREKVKSLQADPKADVQEEAPKEVKVDLKRGYIHLFLRALLMGVAKPPKSRNSFLDIENDDPSISQLRQDSEREKSRTFLLKSVQEVTYHVVPTTNAQSQFLEEQEQLLNHQFPNQHQPTLEEVYLQQRQKQQSINILGPSPLPNHGPPPVPRVTELPPSRTQEPSYMSRSLPDRSVQALPTSVDTRQQYFPENVEKVQHTYDAFGRPQDEPERPEENADPDAWDFDDPPRSNDEPDFSQRPDTDAFPALKSPRGSRRKSSLLKRRPSDGSHEVRELSTSSSSGSMRENTEFKTRFALRGHLDVVRSVIFTGGGSPSEPEICTCGDDGVIKRWVIPAAYMASNDLDVTSYFTHRGHSGAVLSLGASPQTFSNGGRAQGDGWVFSGGQDATVRVWERGRVDPKATLDGHTDAVWTVCVLPGTSASALGDQCHKHGGPERIILASGAADGTILLWSVSTPPLASPHTTSRRGGRRANSVSSGSNFPTSPQPSVATTRPFHYSLVHRIERAASPTCISPLSPSGDSFIVSFTDASVLAYNTRTAEEIIDMQSRDTYDGTPATGVNAVVATAAGMMEGGNMSIDGGRGGEDDNVMHGATAGSGRGGIEGIVLSGHEDRFVRFFDANSGMFSLCFSLSFY